MDGPAPARQRSGPAVASRTLRRATRACCRAPRRSVAGPGVRRRRRPTRGHLAARRRDPSRPARRAVGGGGSERGGQVDPARRRRDEPLPDGRPGLRAGRRGGPGRCADPSTPDRPHQRCARGALRPAPGGAGHRGDGAHGRAGALVGFPMSSATTLGRSRSWESSASLTSRSARSAPFRLASASVSCWRGPSCRTPISSLPTSPRPVSTSGARRARGCPGPAGRGGATGRRGSRHPSPGRDPAGFDRAMVLAGGRVLAAGPIDAVLDDATLSAAYGIPLQPVEIAPGAGRPGAPDG